MKDFLLFLAPLFLLNNFLFNLFLFLQKSGGLRPPLLPSPCALTAGVKSLKVGNQQKNANFRQSIFKYCNTICSRSECEDVFLSKINAVNFFMNITSNDKSGSLPNVSFSFSALQGHVARPPGQVNWSSSCTWQRETKSVKSDFRAMQQRKKVLKVNFNFIFLARKIENNWNKSDYHFLMKGKWFWRRNFTLLLIWAFLALKVILTGFSDNTVIGPIPYPPSPKPVRESNSQWNFVTESNWITIIHYYFWVLDGLRCHHISRPPWSWHHKPPVRTCSPTLQIMKVFDMMAHANISVNWMFFVSTMIFMEKTLSGRPIMPNYSLVVPTWLSR